MRQGMDAISLRGWSHARRVGEDTDVRDISAVEFGGSRGTHHKDRTYVSIAVSMIAESIL